MIFWLYGTWLLPFRGLYLNVHTFNLKFTLNYQQQQITFLDVTIYLTSEGNPLFRIQLFFVNLIRAKLYYTPIVHTLPPLFTKYLHIWRNCSEEGDFFNEVNKLWQWLLERGYSKSCLHKAFNTGKAMDRSQTVYPNRNKQAKANQVRSITKYCVEHGAIHKLWDKYWYLLLAGERIKKICWPQSRDDFQTLTLYSWYSYPKSLQRGRSGGSMQIHGIISL